MHSMETRAAEEKQSRERERGDVRFAVFCRAVRESLADKVTSEGNEKMSRVDS